MSPKKKASKKRSTKKTTGRRENTGIVRRTASPEAVDEAPKAAGNKKKSKKSKSRPLRASGRRLPARSSSAREAKRDYDLIRLNKFLADHGVASRRACDELIAGGKVTIDGVPVTELGTKVDPAIQSIEVNGELLKSRGDRRYYILNKPPGVVCTNERRETRPRAIDMITDRDKGRIYSVGRLDEDSRGLLLLTSDGEFAQRIAHPRFGVTKTYQVRVQGRIEDEAIQKLRGGVYLSEGKTATTRVFLKRRTMSVSTLTITLREGKNREVRRIFARVGYNVTDLKRTDIGPLSVRGLKVGSWRPLSRDEVESLLEASGISQDGRIVKGAEVWGDKSSQSTSSRSTSSQSTSSQSSSRQSNSSQSSSSRAPRLQASHKKASKKSSKKASKKRTSNHKPAAQSSTQTRPSAKSSSKRSSKKSSGSRASAKKSTTVRKKRSGANAPTIIRNRGPR